MPRSVDGASYGPRPVTLAAAATICAATLGNAVISKQDLAWLTSLRRPRMQIPLPAFALVGLVYYLILGIVLYRAADRRDRVSTRLALIVLVLNELWNIALFGRRSTRAGFLGILVVMIPLAGLQLSVRKDATSTTVLAPYTAWVVLYDVPWTFRLWRLNPPVGGGMVE